MLMPLLKKMLISVHIHVLVMDIYTNIEDIPKHIYSNQNSDNDS